jgi:hypothetical protein
MFLNVVSTFKGDGLAAASRQLGSLGKSTNAFGATLGKVGAAIASFGLITKSLSFFDNAIDGARDLERNIFGVRKVFQDFAPEMVRFAENANQIGLSQSEAAKASTFLGSVLKQSGFAMGDVTEKTQQLVETGVDLATLYGYDVQEALLGMTALFRGEYDPIEKFGVAMKQSEVNSELAAKGFGNLEGAARRYQEQIIRFDLFTQRASDSIGAFSEQSQNLFAAQKILTANFKDMQAEVGANLLPVLADLTTALLPLIEEAGPRLAQAFRDSTPVLRDFVQLVRDASDSSTTTGQTFAFLGDALGGTFAFMARNFGVLVQLSALFLAVRTAVGLATVALAFMTAHPVIATLTLIAAGIILINDASKNLQFETDKTSGSITTFKTELKDLGRETDYVNQKYGVLKETFAQTANEAKYLSSIIEQIPKNVKVNVELEATSRNNALNNYLDFLNGRAGGTTPGVIDTGTDTKTTTGGAAAKQTLSPLQQLFQDPIRNERAAKQAVKLQTKGLSEAVAQWITSVDKPVVAAREAQAKIAKNGAKAVANLTRRYEQSSAAQQAAAAAAAAADSAWQAQQQENERIRLEAQRAEEARIEALNQLYRNFLDTIKTTFGGIKTAIQGAFDITGLGGSTNAIIRNMNKLLTRLKAFSTNVKELATMGLDPALLQQIITAGPMAGARIATALVQGGAGALNAINAGYGQVGSLASEIAETGVRSLFDTQSQQNQYNITVTGGVGSGATIGKAIVDAIKDYERTSGAVWQGA